MSPEVVEVNATADAGVTMPLSHLCPFKDEVDKGTVTLGWRVAGRTLELHSVREWLEGFAHRVIAHEELTHLLREQLESLGLPDVSVTTRWSTAGGDVVIRA